MATIGSNSPLNSETLKNLGDIAAKETPSKDEKKFLKYGRIAGAWTAFKIVMSHFFGRHEKGESIVQCFFKKATNEAQTVAELSNIAAAIRWLPGRVLGKHKADGVQGIWDDKVTTMLKIAISDKNKTSRRTIDELTDINNRLKSQQNMRTFRRGVPEVGEELKVPLLLLETVEQRDERIRELWRYSSESRENSPVSSTEIELYIKCLEDEKVDSLTADRKQAIEKIFWSVPQNGVFISEIAKKVADCTPQSRQKIFQSLDYPTGLLILERMFLHSPVDEPKKLPQFCNDFVVAHQESKEKEALQALVVTLESYAENMKELAWKYPLIECYQLLHKLLLPLQEERVGKTSEMIQQKDAERLTSLTLHSISERYNNPNPAESPIGRDVISQCLQSVSGIEVRNLKIDARRTIRDNCFPSPNIGFLNHAADIVYQSAPTAREKIFKNLTWQESLLILERMFINNSKSEDDDVQYKILEICDQFLGASKEKREIRQYCEAAFTSIENIPDSNVVKESLLRLYQTLSSKL